MNKSFLLLIFFAVLAACSVVSAKSNFISVSFYGSVNKEIKQYFQVRVDSLLLKDVVKLKAISQPIEPVTMVNRGDFLVSTDGDGNHFQKYGNLAYKTVDLNNEKTTLFTFAYEGDVIRSFASDFAGQLWEVVKNTDAKQIANIEYKTIRLPNAEQQTLLMHKFVDDHAQWVGEYHGNIYVLEGVDAIKMIGRAGWRKVDVGGVEVVMFMTQTLEKNANWIGFYNGKYYLSN